MSLLGNLVWLIFGGLWTSILYLLGGLVLCLSIVGIPFGLAAINLAGANLIPFGKRVLTSKQANSPLRLVFNIIWILVFGWGIAVSHLIAACLLGITIIGLPWAKQHVKLIPLSLLPFGRRLG